MCSLCNDLWSSNPSPTLNLFIIKTKQIKLKLITTFQPNLEDAQSVVEGADGADLPSLENTHPSERLCVKHTSDGKHGKTAILKLAKLYLLPSLLIIRAKSQGIEAKVSGLVGLDLSKLPESLHSEDGKNNLDSGKRALGNDLLKSLERLVALVEHRVANLVVVLGDLSKSSDHGNTSMLQLSSTVPEKLLCVRVLCETPRVELRELDITTNNLSTEAIKPHGQTFG